MAIKKMDVTDFHYRKMGNHLAIPVDTSWGPEWECYSCQRDNAFFEVTYKFVDGTGTSKAYHCPKCFAYGWMKRDSVMSNPKLVIGDTLSMVGGTFRYPKEVKQLQDDIREVRSIFGKRGVTVSFPGLPKLK